MKHYRTSKTEAGIPIAVLVFSAVLVLSCHPFDNGRINNFEAAGCVRSVVDSSSIPGALVILDLVSEKGSQAGVYTDSLGYYFHRITSPTALYDSVGFHITVTDVDGTLNGVFVSADTLVYSGDLDSALTIVFEVDFYVEMIEESELQAAE
jgi:hypothetical protein